MDFNSDKFCILPWSHLYFFTDGNAYPCPKLAGDKLFCLGKNTDSIESLWHSNVLKSMRQRMMSGKAINQCDYHCNSSISSCKKHVGLDLLDYVKDNIIRTHQDGTTNKITLLGANIIDSNLCNLKCVYCHKNYSSMHYDGTILNGIDRNSEFYTKYVNGLKEIWLAGGEPVINDMSYKILEDYIKNNNTDVRIRVITNLLSTKYKNKDFYKLLSKFKNAIVFGSWDMDGKIGEYIREGSNSNIIKQNIKYIKSYNIKFYLQSVISIFNIMFLFDFHKRLFDENIIGRGDIRYYPLMSPDYYRISILPVHIKNKILESLNNYIVWLNQESELDIGANHEHPSLYIKKIIKLMYSGEGGHTDFTVEKNLARLHNFFRVTNNKDISKYGYFKFLTLYSNFNPEKWL
jgi:MoaA/NifB/PqqE/SkfB family radical SAM enzyme